MTPRASASSAALAPETPSTPGPAAGIRSPSEGEFALYRTLIEREAGISFPPAKTTLLASRLGKRLRELGLPSFFAYYRLVQRDPAERVRMLDCVLTNETHFFREVAQLTLLADLFLPRFRRWTARSGRALRAWSAGCSTGEEPYSLAMLLMARLPPAERRRIDILATDLSSRALRHAEQGIYRREKTATIPRSYFDAFMADGAGSRDGSVAVGPEARSAVHFRRMNLCGEELPPGPHFDLILCRNVLIYFEPATRARVVRRLLSRLAPTGLLLLGHAETLSTRDHGLRAVGPMMYRWAAAEEEWSCQLT